MNSKIILLFFLYVCEITFAQNKRFYYEYEFTPDSTNIHSKTTEIMFLDVFEHKSEFFGNRKFVSDSLMYAASKIGQHSMPLKDIKPSYKIIKLPESILYENRELELGKIIVKDERTIKWTISNDKKMLHGYQAQQAFGRFAGRRWDVWFTTDIPLNDGPYKLRGLPGLIIEAHDATKTHNFKLVGNKDLANDYFYPEIKEKSIELSLEKYKTLLISYRNDPGANIRMKYLMGKIPNQRDSKGNLRTGLDVVHTVERALKERISKENNLIEKDLLSK